VVDDVPVVLVVQLVRGLVVLRHRVIGAGWRRAVRLELCGERRVHVGGVAGREAVPAEGRAVGAADAVRAGERDHVDGVEPLGEEHGLEARDVGERRGKVGEGLAGERHLAVVSPRGHGKVDRAAAEEDAGVAAGEGDDVGAGHDARAFRLQR